MSTTRRNTENNENALSAFVAAKAEIDEMLKRLTEFSDDHFGVAPDEVTWGHVGNLGYLRERLRQASDFIFQEGDCAD